jgi:hypothetical protein
MYMKATAIHSIILCALMATLLSNCDSEAGNLESPATPQAGNETTQPLSATDDTQKVLSIYIDPGIPKAILPDLTGLDWIVKSEDRDTASLLIHEVSRARESDYIYQKTLQVYALAAPFPTLIDDVTGGDIKGFWNGEGSPSFTNLTMSEETLNVFSGVWGEPKTSNIQILDSGVTLDTWQDMNTWAFIAFNELNSHWKVISVGGISPLNPTESLLDYLLAFTYQLSGNPDSEILYREHATGLQLGKGNRDQVKMTRVVMTGVTALVRATADKMETNGVTYPGQDIGYWLRSADITHISNEVSFIEGCPPPSPNSISLQFCSDPKYIGLLEDVGTDVVEMTGNHMNDWFVEGPALSMALYQERGWKKFGGGSDLIDSRRPALFEHNGNKIAFIGCNDPGPDFAFSTETRGGSAACEDYSWMVTSIEGLELDGYLVIATVQYHENYSYVADDQMRNLFRSLADAGAVVVQGSQAHTPKEMEFYDGGFIHYGLGNLFFDQMHVTIAGNPIFATRQEFIDRYTFYNNRLISIELLTAMLEDYSKPRPMTLDERHDLLQVIFAASGWE